MTEVKKKTVHNRKIFNKYRSTLIDKAWGKMRLGICSRRGLGGHCGPQAEYICNTELLNRMLAR